MYWLRFMRKRVSSKLHLYTCFHGLGKLCVERSTHPLSTCLGLAWKSAAGNDLSTGLNQLVKRVKGQTAILGGDKNYRVLVAADNFLDVYLP